MHLQKTSTPDRVSALKLNVTEHKSIHVWTWNKPLLKLTDVLWEEHLKMVVKIKYLFMKVQKPPLKRSLVNVKWGWFATWVWNSQAMHKEN